MARDAHRSAHEHTRLAGHFRAQRDAAIRRLYATGDYSYTTLSQLVGCTRDLVAKIVQGSSITDNGDAQRMVRWLAENRRHTPENIRPDYQ
jgi:hypothetical protein